MYAVYNKPTINQKTIKLFFFFFFNALIYSREYWYFLHEISFYPTIYLANTAEKMYENKN